MFSIINAINDTVRNVYGLYASVLSISQPHRDSIVRVSPAPAFGIIMAACYLLMPRLCQRGRTDRTCGILGATPYPRGGSA